MRSASASSAAVMTGCATSGMIVGGRFASAGCTGARGGTTSAGCSATGGIVGGLGDRLRTLAGGRAWMMPFCGMAACASPGWWSKVGKEKIEGVMGKLV